MVQDQPVVDEEKQRTIRKVAIASLVGTTIEWYDFFLYGTAAALVFGVVFFPDSEPAIGVIAAFATYAVGFLARPIGGLVFGHLGDLKGRKTMLVWSIMIMGIATTLIGLLPGHAQIGILAPIGLVILRLAQGFGVGGEWGGAVLMAVEHAPKGRRGFYGSFAQMGVSLGLLLSTGVFALTRNLTGPEQFIAWGWRVPFLISAVLLVVGVIIRLKLVEPDAFLKAKAEAELSAEKRRAPIMDAMRDSKRGLWVTTGMRLSQNSGFYLYSVFALAYLSTTVGVDAGIGLTAIMISSAIGLITVPAWSALSDRVGRRPVYLFGAVASGGFIFVFFEMIDTGSTVLIIIAMVLGLNVLHDAMYGPQAAFFSELFGTSVRYTGASFGYQIGSVLAGGFAPLIATSLLVLGDGDPLLVSLYFVFMSVLTVISAWAAPETSKIDVNDAGVTPNPVRTQAS